MTTYRKLVTVAVGITFVVVGATGVLFQFFFKNHYLMQLHIWLGMAMVVAAVIHTVQNWRSLKTHLADWRVYTLLIPVAAVCLFFAVGQKPQGREGNPKAVIETLAQANVDGLAKAFGKDVASVFEKMERDGLVVASGKTVQELARENHKSPANILNYLIK
jgi:hypothetical protein